MKILVLSRVLSVITGHMNCIGKKQIVMHRLPLTRCIQFAFLSDAIHMARAPRQNAIQCFNERLPYHNERPPYNYERPYNNKIPPYNNERPQYNNERPYKNERPYNKKRPPYHNEKPPYHNEIPYNNKKTTL